MFYFLFFSALFVWKVLYAYYSTVLYIRLFYLGVEKTLGSPLECKEIQPVHHEGNQSWIFTGRTDAEAGTPILWLPDVKNWLIWKDWCWERLKAGGEGDNRGWDDWMVSPTQCTWVWASFGSWWWTGKPGMLQSVQGVTKSRTRLSDWTELNIYIILYFVNNNKKF